MLDLTDFFIEDFAKIDCDKTLSLKANGLKRIVIGNIHD